MSTTRTSYLSGALCGLAAVSIWAGWSAVTRYAVTTELSAWDITALRFGIPALLLLPIFIKQGLALNRLGWSGLIILVAGGGVPYVLLAASGLRFAPAHHQAALNPGFMPIFVALIAVSALDERLTMPRWLGLVLILAGALTIITWHDTAWSWSLTLGHALFLSAAFFWACFTVVLRRANLDPLHATAIVCVGSAVVYLPIYFAFQEWGGDRAPVGELVLQSIFQGILVTIVSLLLYGRAVEILGASRGAAFGALVPGLSALIAIPLLGEWPTSSDAIAMLLVSIGVYLCSGGPLPTRSEASTK